MTNLGTYYDSVLPFNFDTSEDEAVAYPYLEIYLNPDLVFSPGYSNERLYATEHSKLLLQMKGVKAVETAFYSYFTADI